MKEIGKIITILAIGIGIGWYINKGKGNTNSDHNHASPKSTKETIWTCSMDPQVRQNEPGDCPICGMDLIPADEMGSGSDNPLVFAMTKSTVKLSNIETSLIGSSTSKGKSLKLNGTIKTDETKAASLVAHIPGRIEKLFISYTGEKVSIGQKIATIYAPDLITAQKELLEAQKIINISPQLLEAAKLKMKFWKISDTKINQILVSGKVQEYFDIYAEHSGIVKTRKVSVGDYLVKGEILFDIMNLDDLWVVFDVYEQDLPNIRVGSRISFTTPSVPNKLFKSTITFIDPLINPKTRVATIRGEIRNIGNKLKSEMFTSGQIIGTNSSTIVTIPKTAVLWTGEKSVVYVKVPETDIPSFEFREVELNGSTGSNYIISSGLKNGEEVVTKGAFMIDASAQLNNQTSMMNRLVKIKGEVPKEEIIPDYVKNTPKAFKNQLKDFVKQYLILKDAFVNTDAQLAKKAIPDMLNQLKKVDMSLLQGDAHIYWMDQLKVIKAHSKKINDIDDVEAQRQQFFYVTNAIINSIKAFGVSDDTFYVQHCPMAFDNEGADWISDITGIQNPYFGDKMMKCGVVKDTIN